MYRITLVIKNILISRESICQEFINILSTMITTNKYNNKKKEIQKQKNKKNHNNHIHVNKDK